MDVTTILMATMTDEDYGRNNCTTTAVTTTINYTWSNSSWALEPNKHTKCHQVESLAASTASFRSLTARFWKKINSNHCFEVTDLNTAIKCEKNITQHTLNGVIMSLTLFGLQRTSMIKIKQWSVKAPWMMSTIGSLIMSIYWSTVSSNIDWLLANHSTLVLDYWPSVDKLLAIGQLFIVGQQSVYILPSLSQ